MILLIAACASLLGVLALSASLFIDFTQQTLAVRYGLSAAAAVAVLGLVVLIRFVLTRVPAFDVLSEALHAWSPDTRHVELLQITAHHNDITGQWNRLIESWHQAQLAAHNTQATEQLSTTHASAAGDPKVFDLLPQGLLVIDADGSVSSANGAACRVLMRSRERLIDAPFEKVFSGEELCELVQDVLDRDQARGGSLETTLAQGDDLEAVIRGTVRPLGVGKARQAIVILEDITQQRTADQSRNLFVAQATHELRTPLTNIGLYVERAIELAEDAVAERAECLNVINSEVLRLGRVVEEVLSVSEIEAGSLNIRRDDVRIDELLGRMEDDYKPHAQTKSVALTFDLPPKLSVIQGDREKISVALHNLLGNAIKYTPAGKQVRVEVAEEDGHIEVRVSDTGIGIGPEDLPKIFEKFYRANDKRLADITGTGLGLSLAREVIRLHGGDILAESTLNQGSTFTLRLPLKDPAQTTSLPTATAA